MAGYRFWLQCSIAVPFALIVVHFGRSQIVVVEQTVERRAVANPTCKVYSLADLGDDPKLCKWVAETIPEMIQPASWKHADAKLSFYAPSKILVVNNTPAVHAQVDEFLQSLRKTLPQQKAAAKQDPQVVPAQFALQDPSRPANVVQTGPISYPVPYPPVGPKHLFHFIIRYEGEGIIDSNVAKFTEALIKEKTASSQSNYVFPAPVPPPPPPAGETQVQRASGTNAPPMPPADAPAPSKLPPVDSGPSNYPYPSPPPPPF